MAATVMSTAPAEEVGAPILRVGVIGATGWFFQRAHLPALRRLAKSAGAFGVRIVALAGHTRSAEPVRGKTKAWCTEGVAVLPADALLRSANVDVVDIVVPIPHALPLVEAALRSGKDVISEKPAGTTTESATRALRAAAEAPGPRTWCVLENWAFKPGVLQVRERLESGAIGAVLGFQVTLRRGIPEDEGARSWRRRDAYAGYYLQDVGVHIVRALRIWFGEVERLTATASADVGAEGSATLTFSRPGSRVEGRLSWAFAPSEADHGSVRIVGDRGAVLEWDMDTSCIRLHPAGSRAATAAGQPAQAVHGDSFVTGGVRGALENALLHVAHRRGLLARGRGPTPHLTSPEDAIADLKVVEARAKGRGRS